VNLTIHRGASQIGGNCVEVSAGNTRLILDIGLPLEDPSSLYSKDPRQATPPVPGLFAPGPKVDAVLLSHAHGDHTGLLPFLPKDLPVYCTRGTSKMLMAGSIFAGRSQPKHERPLVPGKKADIRDISVTPLSVDHSAFDSVALLIEADGKRLLYSGDLRLHGRKPGMFARLTEHLSPQALDVLLMEGTNIGRTNQGGFASEVEVEQSLYKCMHENPASLMLAAFSPQHVDRLVSFLKAIQNTDRCFVVDVYTAFVMHLVCGQCRIPEPTKRNGIRVYYNKSFESNWHRRGLRKVHDMFLKDRIELPEILHEPNRFVMLFRPSMLGPDFGSTLPPATVCLYSYWAGYLRNPDFRHFVSALEKVQGHLTEVHTSGHIAPDDLVKFVRALNPRLVIPMHTAAPETFRTLFPNTLRLRDGQEHTI
jgi:ribonuclease J